MVDSDGISLKIQNIVKMQGCLSCLQHTSMSVGIYSLCLSICFCICSSVLLKFAQTLCVKFLSLTVLGSGVAQGCV